MEPWDHASHGGQSGREGWRGRACTGALFGTMRPWGHEPWQAERAGRAGRAEGAGMHWGPFMGPWGHGAMSHGGRSGREGREGRRAGMDWGPLKSAYRRKGHGARRHEATGP